MNGPGRGTYKTESIKRDLAGAVRSFFFWDKTTE